MTRVATLIALLVLASLGCACSSVEVLDLRTMSLRRARQTIGGQEGPVTISAAIQMGVSPQAIAVATAIGCSASFFTPLAHPVNILMIAPGNYTFGDFVRNGWPLTVLSFFMLLLGMVVFWGL